MTITVPLQIIDLNQDGFHPLLNIKRFGKKFTVVLDTGASKTAFDKTLLQQANELALITESSILSTGLGTNSMASFTAVIHDMRIGRLKIPEFEVAVLDLSTINFAYAQMGHPQVLGVIGGDILMQYNAVINYGNRSLRLYS